LSQEEPCIHNQLRFYIIFK